MRRNVVRLFVLMASSMALFTGQVPAGEEAPAAPPAPPPIKLVQTFYYNGNMGNNFGWAPAQIDVDADGTVAVAVNTTIAPGNTRENRWMVLLYNKDGEPVGTLFSQNSGMVDVTFGPDGRVYTAETWFGTGVHVYDRPGSKPRFVPKTHLLDGGYHVDRGGPRAVAVGPDLRIYSNCAARGDNFNKLIATDPEGKLLDIATDAQGKPLKAVDLAPGGTQKIDVAPDGKVYMGNKVLQPDGTWADFKFFVRDIRPDGRFLVNTEKGWGIVDPSGANVELEGVWPKGVNWNDAALGPDNNVYLAVRNNQDEPADLAYVVADKDGKILLTRGADFDRITVLLPSATLTAGTNVPVDVTLLRSRDIGWVPKAQILPGDGRPGFAIKAFITPVTVDPLAEPVWTECPAPNAGGAKFNIAIPGNVHGAYRLQITATPRIPGLQPLAVDTDVTIQPANAIGILTPATDRNRTGFTMGRPIRITVPLTPAVDADLSAAQLALSLDGKPVWQAPLGLKAVKANEPVTAVVTIPGEVTARLGPAVYQAAVAGLPAGAASGSATIHLLDRRAPLTLFQTPMHPIGGGVRDPIRDAKLHGTLGATHTINTGEWQPAYLDVAARLGFTFQYQPYTHYSPINVIPGEQGALKVQATLLAQRMLPYPAFRGFNYHDLQVQGYGEWGDVARKDLYGPLWAEWAKDVKVPDTVAPDQRDQFAKNVAKESMLDRFYKSLGDAIAHADPRLDRTTMQWWHQPLYIADPDHVTKFQTMISTQHMEEQYFHPVSVANQADLWRRPGKEIYVYGNTSWQEDGTGASMYTDFMAALSRGVQGVGRNELPKAGDPWAELVHRAAEAGFRIMHSYGGLSAVSEPDDLVTVWRSFYEECAENSSRHIEATTAAYTACLYGHRTASIITDDLVRAGDLKKLKAVIVSFENPLPLDLAAKLKEFQAGGGIVLANKQSDRYWAPEGAIELGSAFTGSHVLAHSNRDSLRHIGTEEDGLKGATALDKALGDRVRPIVDCDDPTTWVSILKSGKGRYAFTVNLKRLPQPPMDLHRYSGYENTRLPVKSELTLKPTFYTAYDAFAGKLMKPETKGGKQILTADMSIWPGSIIALLPGQIDTIKIAAAQTTAFDRVVLQVEVFDTLKRLIEAAIPLEITITDAAGAVRYHMYRTATNGLYRHTSLRVAANDAPGAWKITVADLLSGIVAEATLDVKVPQLPPTAETPAVEATTVEWSRSGRIAESLAAARKIALVVEEKQADPLGPAADAAAEALQAAGRQVERVSATDYLADRTALQWDKFRWGPLGSPGIKLRPKKYDLVVALDLPGFASGVIPLDALTIKPTATDPGPGRGLVQFVAMPVYDTEDGISLAGGDLTGLVAAAKALATTPPVERPAPREAVTPAELEVTLTKPAPEPLPVLPKAPEGRPAAEAAAAEGQPAAAPAGQPAAPAAPAPAAQPAQPPQPTTPEPVVLAGIRKFLGVPIAELASSPDAKRIAVGLKGWGNNIIFLEDTGKILNKELAGKFFPMQLQAFPGGFAALQHENDPTTLYLKMYDQDGKPIRRLAAFGRRVGGMRDWSASHPLVMAETFLKQASFSLSADGRFAAVAGSKGVAVWNLAERKVNWRDDTIHYQSPGPSNTATAAADSFPQVKLSPDAQAIVVQHDGKLILRNGQNGGVAGQIALPVGAKMGRVQLYDGHRLIVGDSEFFVFHDGNPQYYWKAPKPVTAVKFAHNGTHWAVGESDGTLRLMVNGSQAGGVVVPSGAIASIDIKPDISLIAYSSTTGWIGVTDFNGKVAWQTCVGSRAFIRFLGNTPDTVVGDGRGILHRCAADGKLVWEVDLTPEVYREGIVNWLTSADQTPTLAIPAPPEQKVIVPPGLPNLTPQAKVTYLETKNWWGQKVQPDRSVPLNDGKKDAPDGGWFGMENLEYAAFVPSPPAWEFEWPQPVPINTVVVHESPAHPEAVPEEIKIEAWIDNDWKEVVHTYWNTGTTHAHQFGAVTTNKIRYMPVGDLANNIWLSEIEIFNKP